MSIESNVQSWQDGFSALTALVDDGIAQNAVPQDADRPFVAWVIQQVPDLGLANNVLATAVTTTHECWADGADEADAVADQVVAAMAAQGIACTGRATAYEPDLDLHGTVLTFEWWD